MADKISITYIGNKPSKPDTVTRSRLVFKPMVPVEVDADIALRLLEYPTVWVESEYAEEIVAKREAKEKAIAEKQKAEEEAAKQQQKEESMLVNLDGEVVDLAKYSGKQLETLAEAQDLVIDVKPKPVGDYRIAIRDELRKLNGTPE